MLYHTTYEQNPNSESNHGIQEGRKVFGGAAARCTIFLDLHKNYCSQKTKYGDKKPISNPFAASGAQASFNNGIWINAEFGRPASELLVANLIQNALTKLRIENTRCAKIARNIGKPMRNVVPSFFVHDFSRICQSAVKLMLIGRD
jgi:hypothetical protein